MCVGCSSSSSPSVSCAILILNFDIGITLEKKSLVALRSLSINEFLKPTEGERRYNSGGRGRGPRGGGGGDRFNQGGSSNYAPEAPKIEDPSHFPTLGGK
ncbi:RGG repeats nuclear RNA binding protein A-like protein [Tanacetum coccineum]